MAFLSGILRNISGLLDSDDLNERAVIDRFAGGALRNLPPLSVAQNNGGFGTIGDIMNGVVNNDAAGQIPLSQLSGIGEAVRSADQLKKIGASMPVAPVQNNLPIAGVGNPMPSSNVGDDARRFASLLGRLMN